MWFVDARTTQWLRHTMTMATRKTEVSGLIKSKLIADAKCYNMLRNQCRNWSIFLHGYEKWQHTHTHTKHERLWNNSKRKRTKKCHKFRTLKSGSKFDCWALFVTIHNETSQRRKIPAQASDCNVGILWAAKKVSADAHCALHFHRNNFNWKMHRINMTEGQCGKENKLFVDWHRHSSCSRHSCEYFSNLFGFLAF